MKLESLIRFILLQLKKFCTWKYSCSLSKYPCLSVFPSLLPVSAPVSGCLWLDVGTASPSRSPGSSVWLHPINQSACKKNCHPSSGQCQSALSTIVLVNIFLVWVNPIVDILSQWLCSFLVHPDHDFLFFYFCCFVQDPVSFSTHCSAKNSVSPAFF